MSPKLNSVALDADVSINLFKLGLWDRTLNKFDVYLAETVYEDEALYYQVLDDDQIVKKYIDFSPDIKSGSLKVLETKAVDMESMYKEMNKMNAPLIDPGETETIAAAYLSKVENLKICLIDEAAIKCAVIIGLKNQCLSFEKLIDEFSLDDKLEPVLKHSRFSRIVKEAETHRIQLL